MTNYSQNPAHGGDLRPRESARIDPHKPREPSAMQPCKKSITATIMGLTLATLALGLSAATVPAAAAPVQAAAPAKSSLKPLRVASLQQLKRLLKGKKPNTTLRASELTLAADAAPTAGGSSKSTSSGTQHSTTNNQVAGVDEGDIVKTDGKYLYTVQGGEVRIIQAHPATAMSLLASIKFEDGFYPAELFVDGERLVVIGNLWKANGAATDTPAASDAPMVGKMIAAPMGENLTVARVYDISDRQKPVQAREVSFTGNYLASRKIGDAVYLVGRTYPIFYTTALIATPDGPTQSADMTRGAILPKVGDSAVNHGTLRPLPLTKLSYFPNFVDPNYVVVAGFRLTRPGQAADIKSYLGAGEVAYASLDNLYLSAADYRAEASNASTHIYSFSIDQGGTQFRNAGEVPGTVLNQFSMDEHKGYFRIATTVHQWTQTGDTFQDKSWNNLYSLNGNMKVVGKLENLAEGESIYAARFMGDRAFLVTYRQVDPLFAIDLSDPAAPKSVGELKMPGFSSYLHPFDERHILGIGQETTAVGERVQTSGVKLALFDVSDLTQPKLAHSVVIGEQGSYSDALYDHKAVLFDADRHLLAFPMSVAEQPPGQEWGTTTFQGAHVYDVSVADGFRLKAAITHIPEGKLNSAWNRYIRRLLTIEDQLYTVSEGRVQANELTEFKQTGGVDVLALPEEPIAIDDPVPVDKSPTDGGATTDPNDGVACTMEVLMCPDGVTYVGRSGPNCEFAPCPAVK
ncbi:beta-propeller domain-containing protein [Methylomagnum sp.]